MTNGFDDGLKAAAQYVEQRAGSILDRQEIAAEIRGIAAASHAPGAGDTIRDFSKTEIDSNFYFTWPKDAAPGAGGEQTVVGVDAHRTHDSDFLESADWQTAVLYARAAIAAAPPSNGFEAGLRAAADVVRHGLRDQFAKATGQERGLSEAEAFFLAAIAALPIPAAEESVSVEELVRIAKSASGFAASAREGAAKAGALDSRAASETYLCFADQFQEWAGQVSALLATFDITKRSGI